MLGNTHARRVRPVEMPRRGRVLLIDGDPQRRLALAAELGTECYDLEIAATARVGLHIAVTSRPDLVIFHAGVPDGTGAAICAQLRDDQATASVLVLVISPATASEPERLAAFEAGADDHVTIPVSARELRLRARALLRRLHGSTSVGRATEIIDIGAVRIERIARRVTRSGIRVALTRRELDLLIHLADARGRVRTREEIVAALWHGADPSHRVVDGTLKRLRAKLPELIPYLRTVRGRGYELLERYPVVAYAASGRRLRAFGADVGVGTDRSSESNDS